MGLLFLRVALGPVPRDAVCLCELSWLVSLNTTGFHFSVFLILEGLAGLLAWEEGRPVVSHHPAPALLLLSRPPQGNSTWGILRPSLWL